MVAGHYRPLTLLLASCVAVKTFRVAWGCAHVGGPGLSAPPPGDSIVTVSSALRASSLPVAPLGSEPSPSAPVSPTCLGVAFEDLSYDVVPKRRLGVGGWLRSNSQRGRAQRVLRAVSGVVEAGELYVPLGSCMLGVG
jgi:hypothetical protein